MLYQRIAQLEAELDSSKISKSNRRSGNRKVVLQDQPVESMRPGTAAGGLIQHASTAFSRPGTADTSGRTRDLERQRPSTSSAGSRDAGAASNREERAARMGAQILRLGANHDEDEFEQAFR